MCFNCINIQVHWNLNRLSCRGAALRWTRCAKRLSFPSELGVFVQCWHHCGCLRGFKRFGVFPVTSIKWVTCALCSRLHTTPPLRPPPYSPDEVGAVAAEGRLLEEARDELVVLHFVHVFLPQRALPGEASCAPRALRIRWVGHDGDGMDVVGRNLLDL